jgi:hypothetical protein
MESIIERRLNDEDQNLICNHFNSPVGFELIVVAGNGADGTLDKGIAGHTKLF